MTIQEACTILEVSGEDDDPSIKLKYRKMMAKYHPDAVGSDDTEHKIKAQLINEAYSTLRKSKIHEIKRSVKKTVWKARVNEDQNIKINELLTRYDAELRRR